MRDGQRTKFANGVTSQEKPSGQWESREAAEISARKKSIVGILSNVAELGASRMEETIGKASLRDAAIGTGIAIDKMLALTGQLPAVAVQVNLPTPEERARRDEIHERLNAISAMIKEKRAAAPIDIENDRPVERSGPRHILALGRLPNTWQIDCHFVRFDA